jgi:hypothetical protein
MLIYLIFLNLITLFQSTYCSVLNNSKVSELKHILLQNYRSDVIPNIHEPLNLSLGVAFRAFNNIDQKEGIVISNLWLRYWWNDYNLKWNETLWNISSLTFRTDPQLDSSVWTPDIFLYNTAENPLENIKWSNLVIQSNGDVLWSRPGMIQSTCSFDMTDFPYDRQICELKLGSWSYTGDQLILTEGRPSIDITNYQSNEEWELENISHNINAIKYECCPHKYYDTTFTIHFKRLSGYYETNIIIPTFATASLILITILIPWDSGERISFAVTVMLSIIVFLLILSDTLPKSNQLPLLSRMIMGLTFFSLFGVFFTVLISALNSYKKNKIKGKTEIENPVIRCLFNYCNKVCISNNNKCKNNTVYPEVKSNSNIVFNNIDLKIDHDDSHNIEENDGDGYENLKMAVTAFEESADHSRSISYYSATGVRKNKNALNVRRRLNTNTESIENGISPQPVSPKSSTMSIQSVSDSESISESSCEQNNSKKKEKTKLEESCEKMISLLENVYSLIFFITFMALCIAMFSSKI